MMKKRYFPVIAFAFIVGIIFYSCDKPTPENTLIPLAKYYPLNVGSSITYQVDSINYHEIIPNDSSTWLVKEILVDTFYDINHNLNYKIERYQKLPDAEDWLLVNVWSVQSVDGQIQKVENNLRFIKLTTPIAENSSWQGNIFLGGLDDTPVDEDCNNLSFYEGWIYKYQQVEEPYSINGFNFDNALTVIQEGDSNLIWFDYAKEVYGENVGLIEKEFYHFYTQDLSCPTCPWTERVECGYSVVMKLIEYTN